MDTPSHDERLERISAELSASDQARVEEQKVSLARHEALVSMRIELLRLIAEDDRNRNRAIELEQQTADIVHELADRDRTIAHLQAALVQGLAAQEEAARLAATLERDVGELRAAIRYIRSRSAERDRLSASGS